MDPRIPDLDFKNAIAIGKLLCPPEMEMMEQDCEILSAKKIARQLGLNMSPVKRWISEAVFVKEIPQKPMVKEDFEESDAEPLEILAFYVHSRLAYILHRKG